MHTLYVMPYQALIPRLPQQHLRETKQNMKRKNDERVNYKNLPLPTHIILMYHVCKDKRKLDVFQTVS